MRIWLLVAVAGCGFQLAAGPVDAPSGSDAVEPVDAPPVDGSPPVPCLAKWLDHTVTLSAPAAVAGINVNGQSKRDPTLTSDELVIFWVEAGPGGDDDVWQASRGALGEAFSSGIITQSLSDGDLYDSKVTLTGDGLLAIQATARAGGRGLSDLWQTSRSSGGTNAFGPFDQMYLGALNDAGYQLDPFITADGLELYFAIGNPQRIVVAKRSSKTASFGAPVDVANVGSALGAADPAVSADGRVLLFTSNRPGGIDFADLWYATRTDTAAEFSDPRLVPTINGLYADGDAHLSVDGCRLYFGSTRAAGVYDLMTTTVQ